MANAEDSAEPSGPSEWIREASGDETRRFRLERLTGGASPRRFSRVTWEDGQSAILMEVPPETPDRAFAADRGRIRPFLEVRALLQGAGVRVPLLLAEDCVRGLLLVEDLGETLAERLERRPEERALLYRRAATDLATAQQHLEPLPEGSVVRLRAFDRTLLTWELEHFREWAIVARDHGTAGRAGFERALGFLVGALTALPQGFVHRDYQSRNLMVKGDGADLEIGWIDFQDALMGPRAYDLVALLCDSYQPFERSHVEARLDDYASARRLSAAERTALGREFDLLTVQRKLKDAGRFVFIEKQRNDPSFLPFVRPTLGIVRQALQRLGELEELAPLAAIVEQELRE